MTIATTQLMHHIAGLPSAITDGTAPVAVARFVERAFDAVPALAPNAPGEVVELALHLVPGSVEPAETARRAGQLASLRAQETGFVAANLGTPADATGHFPYIATLLAADGQWHVAHLQPHLNGKPYANHLLAGYALINADTPTITRATGHLRLVNNPRTAFPFRHGVDTVPVYRPAFEPEAFLGDVYQPAAVDTHLGQLRSDADAIAARAFDGNQWTLGKLVGGMHDRLTATEQELLRLLPDELGTGPVDDALRVSVQALANRVRHVRNRIDAIPFLPLRAQPQDLDRVVDDIARLRPDIDALGIAPRSVATGTPSPLPEFDALIERLGSSRASRRTVLEVFDYAKFGRTEAERIRNAGTTFATLRSREGIGDTTVYRFKGWLNALADDAVALRGQLTPEQRPLAPLLDQVEEYARRNGQVGPIRNAAGTVGFEDMPDFDELGRMGASLEMFIQLDDAGRLAPKVAAVADDAIIW